MALYSFAFIHLPQGLKIMEFRCYFNQFCNGTLLIYHSIINFSMGIISLTKRWIF